jgi:hypothetical protein
VAITAANATPEPLAPSAGMPTPPAASAVVKRPLKLETNDNPIPSVSNALDLALAMYGNHSNDALLLS